MRVLYVTPYVPSPVRVRPFQLIRALAALGHEVHLVALQPPEDAWADLDTLGHVLAGVEVLPLTRAQTILNAARALPTGRPLQAAYADWPHARVRLAEVAAAVRPDVIHVEHLRGAALAQELGGGVPLVLDAVDSISRLCDLAARHAPGRGQRLVARLERGATRRFEKRLPAIFDRIVVTSRADADAFRDVGVTEADLGRFAVVPNGVDLEYFGPLAPSPGRPTVLFSGKLSYHANAAAALRLATRVMPEVWRARPDTGLLLAGKDPPRVIRDLARDPRVEVTGYLNDLRPCFGRATVSAAPLVYGVGVQNKVLEALACARPVVTTPEVSGALGGAMDFVLEARDDAGTAGAIVRLLDDDSLRVRLGNAGRAYVERHHHWRSSAERLVDTYLAAGARPRERATRRTG